MKTLPTISACLLLFFTVSTASGQPCLSVAGGQITLLPAVTGAPFTADAVNEFNHVGRDGNRVQQESHGKLYRDSQGRGRCDIENVKTGEIAWANISDPVAGLFIHLNLKEKTAIVTHHPQTPPPPTQKKETQPLKTDVMDVQHSEEDLGSQTIEGFRATGRRYSNTTTAGEHPVMDDWYSADLQITLLSTRKDDRSGSTVHKVVNIHAGDPDPAVFQVPEGYTVKNLYCRGVRCNYETPE
jgi:hypothetical protein